MADFERARAEDLCRLCKKRGFAAGDFLSPAEQNAFKGAFRALMKEQSFSFSFEGGSEGCQRKCPVLLSSDYADCSFKDFSEITPLYIKTTDKSIPDHRSVLGSLLALGLKRSVIGDIFKYDEGTVVFLKDALCPYVQSTLSRIGKSSIFFEDSFSLPEDFRLVYPKEELRFSVSSLRLDCVVSAVCKLAREDGALYIKKGNASINFEEVLQPDKKVQPGDTLSLRGYGRYELAEDFSATKSGRLHITLYHYI
jgi:RNA-binding protein YlmH